MVITWSGDNLLDRITDGIRYPGARVVITVGVRMQLFLDLLFLDGCYDSSAFVRMQQKTVHEVWRRHRFYQLPYCLQ